MNGQMVSLAPKGPRRIRRKLLKRRGNAMDLSNREEFLQILDVQLAQLLAVDLGLAERRDEAREVVCRLQMGQAGEERR